MLTTTTSAHLTDYLARDEARTRYVNWVNDMDRALTGRPTPRDLPIVTTVVKKPTFSDRMKAILDTI